MKLKRQLLKNELIFQIIYFLDKISCSVSNTYNVSFILKITNRQLIYDNKEIGKKIKNECKFINLQLISKARIKFYET